jgi:hypothetical protein
MRIPPAPSTSAAGSFPIYLFRSLLENAGNQVLIGFCASHHEGTLSWSGPRPTKCGHACVAAPEPPSSYRPASTYGWLNFHWEGSYSFIPISKDISFEVELDAVCVNWQSGVGSAQIIATVWLYPLVGPGNWAADVADFFDDNYSNDKAYRLAQNALQQYSGQLLTLA